MRDDGKRGWALPLGAATAAALAALALFSVSRYSEGFVRQLGVSYLIALAVLSASCWAMGTILRPRDRFLALAAGIPAGQLILLLLSILAFGPDAAPQVGFDAAALAVGLAWLMMRPGAGPIVFLAAYEAFALLWKCYLLYSENFYQNFYRGVIVAILVQIIALFALFDGLQRVKHRAAAPRNEPAK
ncbi:MAG: hypothetical protein WAN43_17885 [Rhodomicrobium sp.]|jgi:hypothetical protein